MEVVSRKISSVFQSGGDVIYLLPHFQREYAWDRDNWKTLFKDLMGIYDDYTEELPPEHFLGALVVINDKPRNGTIPAFILVDGQQRLITLSLILCALGQLIREGNPGLYRRIQRMLLNQDETGLVQYKLLPTVKYGDRDAYLTLLQGQEVAESSSKIPEAYHYFWYELHQKLAAGQLDPERLFIVLMNCIQVVFINLDRHERPYEIFESLNAKGKPLTQADLVRNYIAMRLPEADQEQVFENYWSPIENSLQEKRSVGRSRLSELTGFLRHYLALQSEVLCNVEHVYARFRDRMETEFPTTEAFVNELSVLRTFAEYYDRLLRPEHEPDLKIQGALRRLDSLEITTAYPFLMACYEAMRRDILSREQFLDALNVLENYVVRRYLAGEPSNYLNKMFPKLWRSIDLDNFGASLRRILATRNYPTDNRVRNSLLDDPFYEERSQTREKIYLILDTINRFLSSGSGGHTVLDSAPTVEHIMPQTLNDDWKCELGPNWERIHEDNVDTLGNLTLVTRDWNSSLSNASFSEKKQRLAKHALLLNSVYFSRPIDRWDEEAIHARAEFLAEQILKIWPPLVEKLPSVQMASGKKPTAVIILGERIEVESWRDVAFRTAESVAKNVDDFSEIAAHMSRYFRREKFPINEARQRQLFNGWWMYLNLSSQNVKTLCRHLIAAAGILDSEWQLDFDGE